jgi:hypothetical protein
MIFFKYFLEQSGSWALAFILFIKNFIDLSQRLSRDIDWSKMIWKSCLYVFFVIRKFWKTQKIGKKLKSKKRIRLSPKILTIQNKIRHTRFFDF